MEITFINRQSGQRVQEKPPGEGFLRFLYQNPLGQLPLHLLVKRKLMTTLYGRMMASPNSRKKIQPFVTEYGIDMSEAVKAVPEYASFNDFFYRKLKPSVRPVGNGLVSPADGKLLAFENVEALNHFFVKGNRFTLASFLQSKPLAQKYAGGAIVIVRLAPNDYHRFHFPYGGQAAAPHKIRGRYYSVSPYAVMPNFARVFCENKREYTLLNTEDFGQMLISPVGATMVGSIIETYPPNSMVAKGEEMGYFAFGGSSVLMVLEPGTVQLAQDLLANTRDGMETFVRMGEQIGH